MSLMFTHLIFAWLLGKVFEFLTKKKLSTYTWLFLLIGSVLPDTDFLIDWTLGINLHRTFTHSLIFSILAPLVLYTILGLSKDRKSKTFSVALGIGILTHIILDMSYNYGVQLFWPNELYISYFRISSELLLPPLFNLPPDYIVEILKEMLFDTALGTAWIFYFMLRQKLKP